MKPHQRKKPQQRAFHGMVGLPPEPEPAPEPSERDVHCSHLGCSEFITVPAASADARFTCANHTQGKSAKASGARNVPEEIKAWAKISSSGLARTPTTKAEHTEVETSIGLQTVMQDKIDAADDAGSGIKRDGKIKRDKKKEKTESDGKKKSGKRVSVPAGPAFRVPEPTRVPRYLRTVPLPMVPTNNLDAPYGYDENDRPIGMPVGKLHEPLELTATIETPTGLCRCDRHLCMHCHPEFRAQTKVLSHVFPSDQDVTTGLDWLSAYGQPTPTKPTGFPFFPEILGITRRQLLALLDMTVAIEPLPVPKRMLKSRAKIDKQIADIQSWTARVVELKRLIEESNQTIANLSKNVMKYGTALMAPRDPDNIPDRSTREKFKYEERKKIKRAEEEIKTLRGLIRGLPGLDELLHRASHWGKSEADHEMTTGTTDGEVSFIIKFTLPRFFAEEKHPGSLVAYAAFLRHNNLLMDSSARLRGYPHLDLWRYLENEIVRQAISWKLIKPTKATIEKYPDLRGTWTDEDIVLDNTENASILKTGGAEIGASIYGFGTDWRGGGLASRRSGSFDGAVAFGNKDGKRGVPGETQTGSDTWTGDDDAGSLTPD